MPVTIVFRKLDDGRQEATVRVPGDAGVTVFIALDGEKADAGARSLALSRLAALAAQGKPLPPEVDALFERRFA